MQSVVKLSDGIIKYYISLLDIKGENGVYRNSIATGIRAIDKSSSSDTELLDLSEAFILLYRRTGEEKYSIIGKILKKAAHVIYRQLLKINKEKLKSNRFLNVVK